MIGPNLLKAIAAAQADARPILSTALGGQQKRKDPGDPRELWWYFPPSDAVHREIRRLCEEHKLTIILLDATTGPKGHVQTRWCIGHVTSGECMEARWEAEPMPDLATRAHGVAATVRHASRFMPMVLLNIPAQAEVREGERVEGGAVIRRRTAAEQVREVDDADMPSWGGGPEQPGTGGGLPDPGLLGGEDHPALDGFEDFGKDQAEAERAALAADADAAALGLPAPPPVVDEFAYLAAVRKWQKATGRQYADLLIEVRPDIDWSQVKRITAEQRAPVVERLQQEDYLP
jgi:hypothetical protein